MKKKKGLSLLRWPLFVSAKPKNVEDTMDWELK